MNQDKFFTKTFRVLAGMAALVLTFGLGLTGCPMDDGDDGGSVTFTATADNSTANDEATLGFAGESVSSSNPGVATTAIVDGKIVITSVSAGTAVITVSKTGFTSATIPVTVADNGTITIGTVTKGGAVINFTPTSDNSTANTEAVLGLVGTSVTSSNPGVATAAIADGKIVITSVSAGTAAITVSAAGFTPATFTVTVADTGALTIGAITKGGGDGEGGGGNEGGGNEGGGGNQGGGGNEGGGSDVPPVTVTLEGPKDVAEDAFPDTAITLSKSGAGGKLSTQPLAVNGEYDTYRWLVDGTLKEDSASITLNAADYAVGTHQISVEVTRNGAIYSKSGTFTVEG
jgi:hypothetical protein